MTRFALPYGLLVLTLICLIGAGCSRSRHRANADCQTYGLIGSRQLDPLWFIPGRSVEPEKTSRMYLATEQDCGPKPLDDLAAECFQNCPDGHRNTKYYSQIATRTETENPAWLDHLPRNDKGELELTQPLAMDLALLHSRTYQQQFENVYLNALSLSGNQFEFDSQWFGGIGANYGATGEDLGDQRALNVTANRLGFTRNLAGGGQFATHILNSLFWDFGNGLRAGSAALVTTFTQPLLRGAFRHVRLESLTQAERDLLYSVRDFARFRRLFYIDITSSYLDLLTQSQAIRNARTNLENLRQNLQEHEFYAELKMVSQFQVDQVLQQYQNGRRGLLSAEQALIASQDAFKFQLGLPAWLPLKMDESMLDPFDLVSNELIDLQQDAQELFEEIVQYLPPEEPPIEKMEEWAERFVALRDRVAESYPSIDQEMARWKAKLEESKTESSTEDDRLDHHLQQNLVKTTRERLDDVKKILNDRQWYHENLQKLIDEYRQAGPPSKVDPEQPLGTETDPPLPDESSRRHRDDQDDDQDPEEKHERDLKALRALTLQYEDIAESETETRGVAAWRVLQEAVGEQLREEIAELYVAQTQIRLYLIEIEPFEVEEKAAVAFAFQNRTDLMNRRAGVMDAFRRVEVAADALQSDLSVTGSVALGSDPSRNNAFRFDSSANRYTVGVELDGPLNRLNERNRYRAAQIAYQQATREFTEDRDRVANEIRSILRRLELSRLNFLIARQQVVTAARQVDQAQIDLRRSSDGESSLTLFLLQALDGLLDAKNNLISNWIDYRIQKMQLFAALELLYLDEQGNWINEADGLEVLRGWTGAESDYFPPDWGPLPNAPLQ